MLGFLKHKQEAGVSEPVETIKRDHDDEFDMLHAAAEDLMHAVHSKDVQAIAQALRAAFEICDSQPHEEGEHV